MKISFFFFLRIDSFALRIAGPSKVHTSALFFACNSGHLGPWGPKSKKKSSNGFAGPLGLWGRKSRKKSPKRVQNWLKHFLAFGALFLTLLSTFSTPGAERPRKPTFGLFLTLAPKGPNDSCSRRRRSQAYQSQATKNRCHFPGFPLLSTILRVVRAISKPAPNRGVHQTPVKTLSDVAAKIVTKDTQVIKRAKSLARVQTWLGCSTVVFLTFPGSRNSRFCCALPDWNRLKLTKIDWPNLPNIWWKMTKLFKRGRENRLKLTNHSPDNFARKVGQTLGATLRAKIHHNSVLQTPQIDNIQPLKRVSFTPSKHPMQPLKNHILDSLASDCSKFAPSKVQHRFAPPQCKWRLEFQAPCFARASETRGWTRAKKALASQNIAPERFLNQGQFFGSLDALGRGILELSVPKTLRFWKRSNASIFVPHTAWRM